MKTTILVADRDIVLLELLRSRCIGMGLDVQTASRGNDALLAMQRWRPQLACIDLHMPCAGGPTVCEALARDAELARIPLIVLGDQQDERATRACRNLCAYVVPRGGNLWHRIEPLIYELTDFPTGEFARPAQRLAAPQDFGMDDQFGDLPRRNDLDDDASALRSEMAESEEGEPLLEAVFAWFGAHDDQTQTADSAGTLRGPHSIDSDEPPWVLCIEDDHDYSLALKLRLEAHGVAVVRAFDGTAGYRAAFTHPASAILLDYNLPDGQGDYVLRRLKENPVTADVPVIVLTGNHNSAIRRKMFNLGADAYLTKPVDFADLMEVLEPYVDLLPAEYATV